MNENFRIVLNGQEIKLPFDMEQLFKQFIPRQIPEPKMMVQKKFNSWFDLIQENEKMLVGQANQHIIRKIVECKDTAVRNVVIEMNQRLMKLEKMVGKKEVKKITKDKQKITLKIKPKIKISKINKDKLQSNSKKDKKKGSKKVDKKSEK